MKPSYHHFSPSQLQLLKFNVNIRCIRGHSENDAIDDDSRGSSTCNDLSVSSSDKYCSMISREVGWQEKIQPPSNDEASDVSIFTLTDGDVASMHDGLRQAPAGPISLAKMFGRRIRIQGPESNKERLLFREDQYKSMMIMASIPNGTRREEVALCTIRAHQSGFVTATPAASTIEAEDFDDSNVFLSNRAVDKIKTNGERISTYQVKYDGKVYEYSIEHNIGDWSRRLDHDALIDKQNDFNMELMDQRRNCIYKECERTGRLYKNSSSDCSTHAYIEIVSASNFAHPNMLLTMPFGASLKISYKLTKTTHDGRKEVVRKGHTDSVRRFSPIHNSIEFIVQFVVAFVIVLFVGLFFINKNASDSTQAIVLSMIPLILILSNTADCDILSHHFNHQFTMLFSADNDTQSPKCEKFVLELNAVILYSFGVRAVAGCASVDIPTKPAAYDLEVLAWKPIAISSSGTTLSKMHHYYLGTTLGIGANDPVPLSNEQDWTKDTGVKLLSKHDLHTEVAGTIRMRVNVNKNDFCRENADKLDWNSTDGSGSQTQRVFVRETAEEILKRVRRNKRQRMAAVMTELAPRVKNLKS